MSLIDLKSIRKAAVIAALFISTGCHLTQKMGKDMVPDIKAPNSKTIHTALMKTNSEGLHFKQDKKTGYLYSQSIEMTPTYSLRFKHDPKNNETFVIAFNPESEKQAQAQREAIVPVNEKTVNPQDLKIIQYAERNFKVHKGPLMEDYRYGL